MSTSNASISLDDLLGHAGWARSLARSLVSDAAGADDLVQDALVTALKAPPRHRSNLRGWLASVMRNAARERVRRERARPDVEARATDLAETLAPDVVAAEREERLRLARMVRALEEPYRSTVLMRYWHGLEPTEIARQLGVPAGTVRWRLKTALDSLRDDLDCESGEGRRSWVLALLPLASRDGGSAAAPGASATLLAGSAALAAAAAVVVVAAVWRPWADATPQNTLAVAPAPPEPESAHAALPGPQGDERRAVDGRPAAVQPAPAGTVVARVRALDDERRPIAGARLDWRVGSRNLPSEPSGADGVVELALPERYATASQPIDLLLRAPGRATVQLSGPVHDVALELGDIALEPGGGLSGRVVDPDGRPVPGAWLHARDVGDAWEEQEILMLLNGRGAIEMKYTARATRADQDGRFVLDGLPVGTWRIAAGGGALWPTLGAPQEVAAGAPRAIEPLQLAEVPAELCITGRVLDGAGEPVDGASVEVGWRGDLGAGGFPERSGADGSFRAVVPSAATSVTLRAEHRERPGQRAHLDGVRPGTKGLELRLAEPVDVALRVRVLGPDGAPVEGSRLRAYRADAPSGNSHTGFVREADGVLSMILPGAAYVIEADAPGLRMRRLGPIDPTGLQGPIECRLTTPPVVRGRAVAQGEPAAGARVSLWRQVRGEGLSDGLAVRVEPEPLIEGACDATGAFALEVPEQLGPTQAAFDASATGVHTGSVGYGEVPLELFGPGATRPVFVRVERDGCAPLERGPLDPDEAAALDVGELALTPGGTIQGRVVAAHGASAAGAQVLASRGDARPRTVTVGADGRFRLEHLTPGPWDVRLLDPQRAPQPRFASTLYGSLEERPRPIPANCSVEEGGTTTFDLVRTPPVVVLDLRVPFDAHAPDVVRARWLEPGEAPLAAGAEQDWSAVV